MIENPEALRAMARRGEVFAQGRELFGAYALGHPTRNP
jgi:hypothetical protein